MPHFWSLDGADIKANMLVYQGNVANLTKGKGTADSRLDTLTFTDDSELHQLCLPASLNARPGDLLRAVYLYTHDVGDDRVLALVYNASWDSHVAFADEIMEYLIPPVMRLTKMTLQMFWMLAIGCGVIGAIVDLCFGYHLSHRTAELIIGIFIACSLLSEGGIRGHYRRRAQRILQVLHKQGYAKLSLNRLNPY